MSKLQYLIAEINCGVEVYFTARTSQQYNRIAFILCDDFTELTSKLFLLEQVPGWTDRRPNNSFKNYHDTMQDVNDAFVASRSAAEQSRCSSLVTNFKSRRSRRNDFFHSTNLLDVNIFARDCVEALCDLLDFGHLLFGQRWEDAVGAAGTMRTYELLLRLIKKDYNDPSVLPRVSAILGNWPRRGVTPKTRGCEVVHHAEDIHLRLCVRNGGGELQNRLEALI